MHPQVAAQFDIDAPVFLFEVDVAKLLPAVEAEVRASSRCRASRPSSRTSRCWSTPRCRRRKVHAAHRRQRPGGARRRLFDVYEGAPLPEGKRSLAYAVQFQSPDETLTDAEVADARRRIVRRLEHEVGAELRGSG